MKVVAIIPAGGRGVRAGGGVPKQFRLLGGKPLFLHTLEKFDRVPAVDGIILVVPKGMMGRAVGILRRAAARKVIAVCEGGQERQDSVGAGLAAVPPWAGIIVIHDAVRPFVSRGLIYRVIAAAKETGASIAAVPAHDTVKKVEDGRIAATLDRTTIWLAQTPQAFRAAVLKEAYARASADGFYGTDDAKLVERMGRKVAVVEGEPGNIKITGPEDFARGEAIVARRHRTRGRRE